MRDSEHEPTSPSEWAARGIFVVCALAILYLALSSTKGLPSTGWDKANHFLAFAALMFIANCGWPRRRTSIVWSLLGYGVAIEALQTFTQARNADWLDVVADAVGIGAAWIALRVLPRAN